jgi:subtilisin family serine protease
MAVGRGIIVVNSAGNAGNNPSHNTLGAPADGDSVLAVGAVSSTGVRVSFSSVGPTTSNPPRIKPDIMAKGSSVVVASSTNPSGYTTSSGTSFSCPLAAGVAALVLHAAPSATPMEVANALKATASNAANPDNLMGWGILNAQAAITYLLANSAEDNTTLPDKFTLGQNYPNPFNPSTTIRYYLPEAGRVSLRVYDILGRDLATLIDEHQSASTHSISWDGTTRNGKLLSSGIYIYRMILETSAGKLLSDSKVMTFLK